MKQVLKEATPIVQEMAHVGKQFMEAYGAEKRLKNLVDFNDLEHYTLAILAKNQADGGKHQKPLFTIAKNLMKC